MKPEILDQEQIDYPRDTFNELMEGNSPYAFYLFQWVPYQAEAKRYRLKMHHDVKHFDGRIELEVWPNGSHCGSFRDDEVEFIRISRCEYQDPRGTSIPKHTQGDCLNLEY